AGDERDRDVGRKATVVPDDAEANLSIGHADPLLDLRPQRPEERRHPTFVNVNADGVEVSDSVTPSPVAVAQSRQGTTDDIAVVVEVAEVRASTPLDLEQRPGCIADDAVRDAWPLVVDEAESVELFAHEPLIAGRSL